MVQALAKFLPPAALEQLEISHCCIANSELVIQILRIAPGLKSVQINNFVNSCVILEALAQAPANGSRKHADSDTPDAVLCPNLVALDFSRCADVRDGPLVRIAPIVVSVGDPAMIPVIYNVKGDFKKTGT